MDWIIAIVVIVLVLLLVLFLVSMYNRLVRLRTPAEDAGGEQGDVQLRKRYDLIPNLVETVKGYASHERETFEEVTRARTAAQQAQGVAETGQAEDAMPAGIG